MAINWTQVNVPTILAVLGTAYAVVSYINNLENRVQREEEYRTTRAAQIDSQFAAINGNISRVSGQFDEYKDSAKDLPFRVQAVETGLSETNKRVDRLSELLLDGIDGIKKDVNTVGTKVEVLSSKVDSLLPPPRKASLQRPPVSGLE